MQKDLFFLLLDKGAGDAILGRLPVDSAPGGKERAPSKNAVARTIKARAVVLYTHSAVKTLSRSPERA